MAAGPSWNDDELLGLGFPTDSAATGDGSLIAVVKRVRDLLAATSGGKTLTYIPVNQGAAGSTVLAASSSGNKHKIVGAVLTMSAAGTLKFTDGSGDLTGPMDIAASGGFVLPTSQYPYQETAATSALNLVTATGAARGVVIIVTEV